MPPELTPAQIQAVKQGIKDALEAKEICRKGQACGFDMAEQEAVADQIIQRSQAVLANFGNQKRNQE